MTERRCERVLDVNGMRLACTVWGDPEVGLPVLALHGWLDNAASFDPIARHLPRLCLCALDLPGHGLSQHRPEGGSYHFIDYVADALAVVDALEWTRFALIGHSLGAGIATLLATVAPDRVQRAVLIEGLGPATSLPTEAPALLRRALADARRAERSPRVAYASFDEAVRARMAGISKVSEQAARLLCERGVERSAEGYLWRSDRRLRAGSRLRLTEEQVLAFIREMHVPTLLIRAEPGYPFDEPVQSARVAAHPDLRVVRVAGGHHLHMEAASARVAGLIEHFLCDEQAGPGLSERL
jgi:pimeloyl-ACP methyl ester carboxylesterase